MNILTKTEPANETSGKIMGILDHIEQIIDISKKVGIDKSLSKAKKHLDYVTKKLGITPIQAVIFSHFMEKSNDNSIQISEVAESLKCGIVRILKYMNECEELEKKKLIRCRRNDDCTSYRIPRVVSESLRKYNEFRPEKTDNLSIVKFFTVLERIFAERSNNELSSDTMQAEALDLVNQNMHLYFCKKIMSYGFCTGDLVMLLCFCVLFANNNDDNVGGHDLEFLFDDNAYF
jgi:hypothetical protein